MSGRSSIADDRWDTEYTLHAAYFIGLVSRMRSLARLIQPGASVELAGCLLAQTRDGARFISMLASPGFFASSVTASTTETAETGETMSGGRSAPGTRISNVRHPERGLDISGSNAPWFQPGAIHTRTADWEGRVHDVDSGHDLARDENGELLDYGPPPPEEGWGGRPHPAPARPIHVSHRNEQPIVWPFPRRPRQH
jgi:CubicO group peptidase (beta-lactamase class C family)